MARRDPQVVARERARLFGLTPERPARRRVEHAYALAMAFVLTALALMLVPELAAAQGYVVGDNGLTLAQAIQRANASPGADTVTFAPSAASDTFTQPLPTITDTLTIDGGSGVHLDFAAVSGDAFTLDSNAIMLKNLALSGASGNGIDVTGGGNDTFTRLSIQSFRKAGMVLGGTGSNTIGGVGDTFTVSGNGTDGIDIPSASNLIQDAVVGFGADGSAKPNGGVGISASAAGNQVLDSEIGSGATAISFPNVNNLAAGNTLEFMPPGLGVDVGAAGRTPNSPGAATNFPTITAATIGGDGTAIDGSLTVEPNVSGAITIYEQMASGNLTQYVPFADGTFSAGSDGTAKFHVTTKRAPAQGQRLVAFQSHSTPSGPVTSEASDPFDPFAGQNGGGGGQNQGGGGQRTCPFVPAVQSLALHFGAGESALERYVDALIQAVLGRSPAHAEVSQLAAQAALITRQQMASAVILSQEGNLRTVDRLYTQLLGRSPSPTERGFAVGALSVGGARTLEATVLGSNELFACSGGTNAAFIDQLYEDLLGRPADQAAQTQFGQQLAGGALRSAVVSAVMSSLEARQDVVRSLYQQYLGRQPDAAALNLFAGELSSSPQEMLAAQILSSAEFLARIGTPPLFGSPTILRNGIIAVDLLRPSYLRLTVFRVGPVSAAATKARRVGVVRLGRHRKGRVRLRWNRKVAGHRLRRGTYVVVLQATDRRGRVLYESDPVTLTIRR